MMRSLPSSSSRSSSRSTIALAAAFSLSIALVACGGSTADPADSGAPAATTTATASATPPTNAPPGQADPNPNPPSAPTVTVPPSTPPKTPGACHALVNDAAVVVGKQVAASAPLPTGGAVSDGTYHLVDLTLYTGPGGAAGALALSIKQTIAIHGGTADAISEANGKSQDLTSTFVTSGTSVTLGQTCPSGGPPKTGAFSATAASLVMFLVNDVGQTVGYTYAP